MTPSPFMLALLPHKKLFPQKRFDIVKVHVHCPQGFRPFWVSVLSTEAANRAADQARNVSAMHAGASKSDLPAIASCAADRRATQKCVVR